MVVCMSIIICWIQTNGRAISLPPIVFQLGSERVEFFAAKQRQSAISATVFGVVSADQTDDLICELNDLVDDMIAAILTDQKLGGSVDMTDELDFQTVAMETFGIAETTLTYRFERNGENGVANVARTWRIENVAAGTYTFGNGVFATVPNNLTNAPYVEVQELTDSVGYPDAITATGFELVDQGTGSEALSALVTVREKLL
jgi:hypothetical protein